MKLSLSGMTPFVIGEFVNSLFPCVDRDVISTWRAFVGSFVKAHAMTILSYTRFSLLLRLVRPLLFIHTPVHNNSFHSPTVSLKLHCEHSEQIKRNKRLFHGSKPGGFCVVLIERIDCSLTKRNTLVLLIDYISAVVFKLFLWNQSLRFHAPIQAYPSWTQCDFPLFSFRSDRVPNSTPHAACWGCSFYFMNKCTFLTATFLVFFLVCDIFEWMCLQICVLIACLAKA